MANKSVTFYRLGRVGSPVSYNRYRSLWAEDGRIIFAVVKGNEENPLADVVNRYIYANGIEYIVPSFEDFEQLIADFKVLTKDWDGESSIQDMLEPIIDRLDIIDSSIANIESDIETINENIETINEQIDNLHAVDSSLQDEIHEISTTLSDFMDSSLVHTITGEGDNYVNVEPAEATSGEVTVKVTTNVVSMADASTDNTGLADALDVKQWVLEQVAALHQFSYKVVDELPPLESAEEYVIYLIKDEKAQEGDWYVEWLLVEGRWEKLGDTKIALQDYYTKEETDEIVENLDSSINDRIINEVEEINDRIDEEVEKINNHIDSSVAEINDEIDEIKDQLENGVVSSVATDTEYMTVDPNQGDVNINAAVVKATDTEYENIPGKQGLATAGWVEERLEQYNWIEIDDAQDKDPVETPDFATTGQFESETGILTNLDTDKISADSVELTAKDEVTLN